MSDPKESAQKARCFSTLSTQIDRCVRTEAHRWLEIGPDRSAGLYVLGPVPGPGPRPVPKSVPVVN